MSPAVNIEHKTLNDILLWVAQLGEQIQNASEKVQKIQEKIALYYRKVDRRELETMLNANKVSTTESDAFIYLPAIDKGDCFVPVMCVEYDYSLQVPELHLRIALFLISEKDGEETLQAIGYRFETGHEKERHTYCHIQHITRLGQSNRYILPCPEWVPMEYPAFPIDAQNPIELLVCLLVSLYDLKIVSDLEGIIKSQLDVKKKTKFYYRLAN